MKITKFSVNQVSYEIIGCAIKVHKYLGPGLLESVYQSCLIEELKWNNFNVKSQITVPLVYRDARIANALKLDLLVNDLIVVELKAVENMLAIHEAQLLSYLKLSGYPKGLLINFNCMNITSQLVPLVTKVFAELPE